MDAQNVRIKDIRKVISYLFVLDSLKFNVFYKVKIGASLVDKQVKKLILAMF